MSPLADLDVERRNGVPVAALSGEVDLSNASQLRGALERAVGSEDPGLVLDLSATTYLDSSGIKLLFDFGGALGRRQQQLRLVVPGGSPLARTIVLVEMRTVLPVDPTADEAIAAIAAELGPREPG